MPDRVSTPLMVSFHPAYILRQTGGEIEAVKRLVWSDLKAVRAKLDERRWRGRPVPESKLPVDPQQVGLFGTSGGRMLQ